MDYLRWSCFFFPQLLFLGPEFRSLLKSNPTPVSEQSGIRLSTLQSDLPEDHRAMISSRPLCKRSPPKGYPIDYRLLSGRNKHYHYSIIKSLTHRRGERHREYTHKSFVQLQTSGTESNHRLALSVHLFNKHTAGASPHVVARKRRRLGLGSQPASQRDREGERVEPKCRHM